MEGLTLLQSMIASKELSLFHYVLQIDVSEYLEGNHHFVEKTCFCHVSLEHARCLIREPNLSIEAIVISPNHRFSVIEELRNDAKKRSIPFILFSLKFEQHIKDMAIALKTDDYQCGVLNLPLDYIKFMKRLKCFKPPVASLKRKLTVKTTFGKRCFDVLASSMLLFALLPVLALVTIMIKAMSRGPVLDTFQQAGFGYKIFDAYEFRTYVDVENAWATRFCYFLRKSGLNKLPELVNVIKGDISLIGEKPLLPNEAAMLTTDRVAVRLLRNPGLTGLWGIGKQKEVKFQPMAPLHFSPPFQGHHG